MTDVPPALAAAREELLALVSGIRPELHRHCAPLTGSVIDGEDIVQERAVALSHRARHGDGFLEEPRRQAHRCARRFRRRRGFRRRAGPGDRAGGARSLRRAPGHAAERGRFEGRARSLARGDGRDDGDHSDGRESCARPRAKNLAEEREREAPEAAREELERYVALFNARDWDGVRALVADDCRLDLVSRSQRRGKQVGLYFTNYEKADVRLRIARVDGALALGAYPSGATRPAYFVLLELEGGRVKTIRDFRYVPYIADEADVSDV